MNTEFDCAVVGAGVVGAVAALALARQGTRVAVIDARRPLEAADIARDARGLVLAPASQRVLAELGIWERLAAVAVPVKYVEITDRGHFGAVRLAHTDLALPALGHVCPGGALLAAVEQVLAAEPRCTLLLGARLARVDVGGQQAVLGISREDTALELRAPLLVGADGAESRVREHHGIAVRRRDYGQTAIVATAEVTRPAADTAFERFTRDGPFAVLPLGGRRIVVVRTARSAEADGLLACTDHDFCADLAVRAGGRFGRFFHLGPRRAYALALSRAERITAPRTVLVGNAANTLHPNAAQGLNLGLRDCAALARCVGETIAAGRELGTPRMLDAYCAARARDHAAIVRFTDGVARVFGTDFVPAVALRGAALLACDLLPPLRRRLLQRLTGLGEPTALSLARSGA